MPVILEGLISFLFKVVNSPLLLSFCAAIFAVAGLFFWRTYADHVRAARRLRTLAERLGDAFLSSEERDGKGVFPSVMPDIRSGAFEKIFEECGFPKAGHAIVRNTLGLRGCDEGICSEEVISSALSSRSLEGATFGNAAGRSAILTTLGVVGTFVGLIVGVSSASEGLADPDINVARDSLSLLLSGAELAFITSILGLLLALLHSFLLGAMRNRMRRAASHVGAILMKGLNARTGACLIRMGVNRVDFSIEETQRTLRDIAAAAVSQNEAMASQSEAIGTLSKAVREQTKALSRLEEALLARAGHDDTKVQFDPDQLAAFTKTMSEIGGELKHNNSQLSGNTQQLMALVHRMSNEAA
jgi:hypothetical protein